MKTSIRIHVLDIFITQLIYCTRSLSILISRHRKIIMINKVITRIIRRININHLHLTQIRLLEKFKHFEIISLNIKVLGVVPIHTILLYRTQCLLNRLQNFGTSCLLANPVELVCLRSIFHCVVTKKLAKYVKINYSFYPPPIRVGYLRKARRRNLIKRIQIQLRSICRLQFHSFRIIHIFYYFYCCLLFFSNSASISSILGNELLNSLGSKLTPSNSEIPIG